MLGKRGERLLKQAIEQGWVDSSMPLGSGGAGLDYWSYCDKNQLPYLRLHKIKGVYQIEYFLPNPLRFLIITEEDEDINPSFWKRGNYEEGWRRKSDAVAKIEELVGYFRGLVPLLLDRHNRFTKNQ